MVLERKPLYENSMILVTHHLELWTSQDHQASFLLQWRRMRSVQSMASYFTAGKVLIY